MTSLQAAPVQPAEPAGLEGLSRQINAVLAHSVQLESSGTYRALVASELCGRCFYDVYALGFPGLFKNVTLVVLQNPASAQRIVEALVIPWMPKAFQGGFSSFLSMSSDALKVYTLCSNTIPLATRALLGLTGLYISKHVLTPETQQGPLAALALFGLHKLGWQTGVDRAQTQLGSFLNTLPQSIVSALMAPSLGVEGAQIPAIQEVCLPEESAVCLKLPQLEGVLECPAFPTQEALNKAVAKLALETYRQINEHGLWTYPAVDAGGFSTESTHWDVVPPNCGKEFCLQNFVVKDPEHYRAALLDILNSKTQLNCSHAQTLVKQYVILALLGESYFDTCIRAISQGNLSEFKMSEDSSKLPFTFLEAPCSKEDLEPLAKVPSFQENDENAILYVVGKAGNFIFIKNTEVYLDLHKGFWRGHHLAIVDKDQYIGFGAYFKEPKSYDEIVLLYYRETNAPPTKLNFDKKSYDEIKEALSDLETFKSFVNYENNDLVARICGKISLKELQALFNDLEGSLKRHNPWSLGK